VVSSTAEGEPLAKVGRERIEVQIQPITGEEWDATRSQALSQGMNDAMGHVLSARTELEHGKNFRTGIDDQPEPQHLCMAAQPGSQFVQLKMRDVEMAEEALVQSVRVLASTGEPNGNRGLTMVEDPLCSGKVQPFGQRSQYHGDLLGGRFQPVQGRITPRSERGAAGLAAERLDAFGLAMLAISH